MSYFLTGKLLLAAPGMLDERFRQSVIYIFDHNADGAMGFILNQKVKGKKLMNMLETLPVGLTKADIENIAVYIGGPVQDNHGFVLHSLDYQGDHTFLPNGAIYALTASFDILKTIARTDCPKQHRLFFGYAGWQKGQIETELKEDSWLICDAAENIAFHQNDDLYHYCLQQIGVSALHYSPTSGEA